MLPLLVLSRIGSKQTKQPHLLLIYMRAPFALMVAMTLQDLSLAYPAVVQGKDTRGDQAPPLYLLYALLIANGNFIAPKAFVLNPDGSGDLSATKSAMRKLLFATSAAGVGLFAMPVPTATGLAAYAFYALRPGGPLRIINQHWKPAESKL